MVKWFAVWEKPNFCIRRPQDLSGTAQRRGDVLSFLNLLCHFEAENSKENWNMRISSRSHVATTSVPSNRLEWHWWGMLVTVQRAGFRFQWAWCGDNSPGWRATPCHFTVAEWGMCLYLSGLQFLFLKKNRNDTPDLLLILSLLVIIYVVGRIVSDTQKENGKGSLLY